MSQERFTVRKIIEVLRLNWECQISERPIVYNCRLLRSTILKRAVASGLKWLLSEEISDNQLYNGFSQNKTTKSNRRLRARLASSPTWNYKKGSDLAIIINDLPAKTNFQ